MKKAVALLLLLAIIVLPACSSKSNDNHASTASPTPAGSTKPAASADPSKVYNLSNDGVDPAVFAEKLKQFPEQVPTHVVTTSVALAEMLHLLGIMPVGVPTSTNPLPDDLKAVKRIGSSMQPDLEIVSSLQTDLLLGAESLRSTLDKNLEGIKLNKSYLPTDSFEDLKLSIKVLGTYFKKTTEMNAVLTKILDQENALIQKTKGKKPPTVMLIIGTSDSFMVMNDKSYLGSLVKRTGADNIATSVLKATSTYSAINMESVLTADPDIILVLASGDHGATVDKFNKEVEKNTAWTKLSAYKNKKITVLDYSVFGVTSIKNVDQALTQVSSYMYP